MKSTWFSNRKRYDFAKCLQSADYAQHSYELMRLFLQAALGAFRQGAIMATGRPMDDAIEQTVIDAQQRVKHPGKLSECLAIMTMALEDDPHDFLGSLISELDQNDSKWKGQCFTPPALCQMMAELTITAAVGDAKPDPDHRLMLNEPACGGGAMVIATSEVLKRQGFYPWNYYWVCVDVDWRMFAISYIQLTLLGIPANVINGNTLSLEIRDSAETLAAVLHPVRRRGLRAVPELTESAREDLEPDREPEPLTIGAPPARQQTLLFG